MEGYYELTTDRIYEILKIKSAGNYALGFTEDKIFYTQYIGRSDEDLNKRLQNWVGSYKRFKFSYATSPKAAFDKECMNYHTLGENEELDNENHPDRPDRSFWKCQVCDIYDRKRISTIKSKL